MSGLTSLLLIFMLFRSPLGLVIAIVVLYLIFDRLSFRLFWDLMNPVKRFFRTRALEKGLEANPHDAVALLELGEIYFKSKRYNHAIEVLQKAYSKMNDSAELHLYLGMALFETKVLDNSKIELEKAIQINKNSGYGLPFLYLLKNELSRQKPDIEALKKLEENLEGFENIENLYYLGKFYKENGENAKRDSLYKTALKSYRVYPRIVRRLHRKWAWMIRLQKYGFIIVPAFLLVLASFILLISLLFTSFQAEQANQIQFLQEQNYTGDITNVKQ